MSVTITMNGKSYTSGGGGKAAPAAGAGKREAASASGRVKIVMPEPKKPVAPTPEKPSLMGRVGSVLSGAAKGYGGGLAAAGAVLHEFGSQPDNSGREYYQSRYDRAQADYMAMLEDNRAKPGSWSGKDLASAQNAMAEARAQLERMGPARGVSEKAQEITDKLWKTAGELKLGSAADVERAKTGLGGLGQFTVDVGVAGSQMLGDIGLGLATGGALVPMAARVFGGNAQTAREDGATLEQQLAYGALGAAASVGVERLTNIAAPFAKAFGKGVGDDIVEKAISRAVAKVGGNKVAQGALNAILRTGASAVGEGAEEALESAIDVLARRATYDSTAKLDAEETLYNFLVGAAMGGLGGGVELVAGRGKGATQNPAQEQTARETAQDAAREAENREGQEYREVPQNPKQPTQEAARGQNTQEAARQMRERLEKAKSELERTGIMAGATDETIQQAQRIARAVGREVVFFREEATTADVRNGYYSKRDGKIHVNAASQNPVAQIIAHELTHGVELADAYGQLNRLVIDRIRKTSNDLEGRRAEVADRYRRNGVELTTQEDVDREIVAEYVEKNLLTDEVSIREMVNDDPGLGRRILDLLNSILAKLGNKGAQEREFLLQARETYRKALGQAMEIQSYSQMEQELERLRGEYAAGNITEEEFEAAMEGVLETESELGRSVLEQNSFSGARTNDQERRADQPDTGDKNTAFADRATDGEEQTGLSLPKLEGTSAKETDIQYSIGKSEGLSLPKVKENARNEAEEKGGEEKTRVKYDDLPAKARNHLKGVERKLLTKMGNSLGVPQMAQRDFLEDVVRKISEEYLNEGRVSQETTDSLFEQAYEQGIVVEREFYESYKGVKDFLRSTAINVGEELRNEIADFGDWRRSAFGSLRLVNEGGQGVDSVYYQAQEMAPELFPSAIDNPADQLMRMLEVSKSIVKTEHTLNEVYGQEAEEFKRLTKHDFESAVSDVLGELRDVKRYTDDQTQKRQKNDQAPQMTEEEVASLYGQMKDARKTYEKVAAKNLLTEHDEAQVGKLLRGDLDLEDLDPAKDNVKGITAVFESKREYDRIAAKIREWNRARKAKLRETADEYLKTAGGWKDKKAGILYSAETMERNIRDIVKDRELAKRINDEYFKPVHDAQAASSRMKNQYRERVRQMGLSRKVAKGNVVSEAHAVQLLGEAEDNIRVLERSRGRMKTRDGKTLEDWRGIVADLWKENPGLDRAKINAAVKEFRAIYDELFTEMNRSRIHNGYEPVNYRSGYFPHFQPGDGDGILTQFGKAMGVDMGVTALPTTINGLTHTFKPGIQWFGNAQERLGFDTAYDAVEGFDRYIEGVADVVHQTENIQKLRALASQVRYRTSDEGLRRQVDEVKRRTNLSDNDKQVLIDEIYENGRFELGNFVVELDEYTNLLANKKSRADRNMEQALGRRMYNLVKTLESRVAANMVAVNPASWLTNFIPITQGAATLDSRALLKGMWGTLRACKEDDGVVGRSSFLTNRRGSDPLVRTWAQAASAKLSSPMELFDSLTADTLVRARYQQNLSRGMSEESAMGEADSWAAGVMADRSKGATPTLFNRSNPVTKLFTQFQLEVNNQLRYLFKDLRDEVKDRGAAVLAGALLKFFLGAYLYNEIYEYFIGRRPALDPIGILNDTVGDLTGYELPNLLELLSGDLDKEDFRTEKVGTYEAVSNLGKNVAEELPFVGGILGGGRVPVSSALPDWEKLSKAVFNEKWDAKKRTATAAKELGNSAFYLLPPFGGGQWKKILQGLDAVNRGGSYSVDSDGNDILQYPVYRDTAGQAAWSAAGAMVFGKSSLPTGREWVESGFKSLGAKETAAYQGMMAAGVPGEDAYKLIQELRGAKKTKDESAETVKRKLLEKSGVDGSGKFVAYFGLMASKKERMSLGELVYNGMSPSEALDLALGIRAAEKQDDKLKVVGDAALTDREARTASEMILGGELVDSEGKTTTYGKLVEVLDSGVGMKKYVELKRAGVVEEYLENVGAGVDTDAAAKIVLKIAEIKAKYKAMDDEPDKLELYRAAVDAADEKADQTAALQGLMTETEFLRLEIGSAAGVLPERYVEAKERMKAIDDNGSISQDEATRAINSMTGLTLGQKATLWQVTNKSWQAKSNPYSRSVGAKVKDDLEKALEGLKLPEA